MEILDVGIKERRKNGNWRVYFLVKNGGREYYRDYQVRTKLDNIPSSMILSARLNLKKIIEDEIIAEANLNRPIEILRTAIKDIKAIYPNIDNQTIKDKIQTFIANLGEV